MLIKKNSQPVIYKKCAELMEYMFGKDESHYNQFYLDSTEITALKDDESPCSLCFCGRNYFAYTPWDKLYYVEKENVLSRWESIICSSLHDFEIVY